MPDFRIELVNAAQAELTRFGGLKETQSAARPFLIEYWTTGAGRNPTAAKKEIKARTAWSAAFISFVVKRALKASKSSASFKFSASHSEYVGDAIRNVLQSAAPPGFFGLPPTGVGAVQPEVGDIFGSTRVVRVDDYADALDEARKINLYFSHFDVVTEVKSGKLKCIGGNVSQSVTEKTITLTKEGLLPERKFKFDAAGRVIEGPFICIIKHRSN